MSTHLISTFAKRLEEALEIRKMTPAELSKLTNIHEGTISNYRKGKYKPKQDKLEAISSALNVSAGWLLGADVPMESQTQDNISQHELSLDEQLKGVEFALWGEVRDLTDDEKQDILDFIKFKKSQRKK